MSSTAVLALWTVATVGHFALTALWIRRIWRSEPRDVTFLAWALVSVAALASTVHLTSALGGVTLGRGVAALAIGHACAFVWLRRRTLAPRSAGITAGRVDSILESTAIVLLAVVVATWCDAASRSLAVSGSDAAHYHVPVAVNLALGAGFLDLPPTSHLYPMASSALAAWFILPFKDTLLVDLTMLLPFLLLAASSARLFRLLTGLSGLAWTTGPLLVLFATPLFRASSLMSADLLFAAAFVALVTQIVVLLTSSRRPADLVLAGLATGLIVGSKTTGLPTAGIVWGLAAVLWFLTRHARQTTSSPWTGMTTVATIVGAAAGAIAAGGIWLIRNWLLWGSPLGSVGLSLFGVDVFDGAPAEPTTYLSIVGDISNDPSYDVVARTIHFTSSWLTPWFLPALLPLVVYVLDLAQRGHDESGRGRRSARLAALVLIAGSAIPMIWLLAGAPWTSLEWTRGYSLRYILPWLAAFPLLAFIGCFPNSYRWITHDRARAVAGAALLVAGVTTVVAAQLGNGEPPRFSLTTGLGIGAAFLALYGVTRGRSNAAAAVTACLVAALGTLWAVQATRRNRALVATEEMQAGAPQTPADAVYAAALDFERQSSQACAARRFFILTRFDEPMALQSPVLRNRVYYAARDVRITARSAPMATCDYVITSRAVLGTDKGRALIAVLNPGARTAEIAEAGSFVLMAPR